MNKIDVAGLQINSLHKQELINQLSQRIHLGQKTFITTPYSEFLYRGLVDPKIFEMLNSSDFAVPDGIGIFWASKFLSIPLTAKSYYTKTIQACWQALYSLAAIIVTPSYITSAFAERIPGSELIWDLAALATSHNLSLYILGGFGNTPELTAQKLVARYPNIRIVGTSNKNSTDDSILEEIKKSRADMLFVAFGPITQEQWIAQHITALPCKVMIGLGGTFDYIAGTRTAPPAIIRAVGLEWLWRLITQPRRIKRIWQATAGLVTKLISYKIYHSLPYRKNVVSVIINRDNKIFVGLRKPDGLERNNNHWMFPQGGLENHEDIVSGARREVYEEVGLTSLEFIKISDSVNSYFWEPKFSKKFKGQEQNVVYFRFTGKDDEINFETYHTQEFIGYQWVPLNQLSNTIHPLRKQLADIVLKDLS